MTAFCNKIFYPINHQRRLKSKIIQDYLEDNLKYDCIFLRISCGFFIANLDPYLSLFRRDDLDLDLEELESELLEVEELELLDVRLLDVL